MEGIDVTINGWVDCCNPVCDGVEGAGERRGGGVGGGWEKSQPCVEALCLGWTTEMRGLAWFWDLEVGQGLRGSQECRSGRSVPYWHKEAFLWTTGLQRPGTRTGDVRLQKGGWHTHTVNTHIPGKTEGHSGTCRCISHKFIPFNNFIKGHKASFKARKRRGLNSCTCCNADAIKWCRLWSNACLRMHSCA